MTRIIVAGGGRVGRQIATELSGPGNTVTVVDRDRRLAHELERQGLRVVCGDACVAEILEEAGGLSADVLVACTGRDEENLVISTVAKRHLEIPRVVARVNDIADRWLFDEASGVDAAISSALSLVALIEEATGSAPVVRLADLSALGLVVIEANVGIRSPANRKRLSELGLADGDIVATVIRHGHPMKVDDDLRLTVTDRVLLLTDADGEARVHAAFG